jgi:SulP family sulfate permease
VVYRFYGPLLFANVRFFIERLEYFIAREVHPVFHVILDARAIPEIDVTAAEQLHAYFKQLRERGITVAVAKAHLPLRDAARRLGFGDVISEDTYFQKVADAVSAFENGPDLRMGSGR